MPLARSFVTGDLRVKLHLGPQILGHDVPRGPLEPTPAPALDAGRIADFVPAGVLLHKAKQVDDGVMAAVQLLIQQGGGGVPGRRWLLARLAHEAARPPHRVHGEAFEVLLAACRLGGVETPKVPRLDQAVAERVERFTQASRLGVPLGIYTWSKELRRTFVQERMLHTRLTDVDGAERLAAVLAGSPRLASAYDRQRQVALHLSGPPVVPDLRSSGGRAPIERAIFPAADSPEAALVRAIGDGDVLGGSLMDELVARVRSGRIDPTPGPRPGWYAHTLWSLAPLLRLGPEGARLHPSADSEEYLEALFRAGYALARETHELDEEAEEEEEGDEDEDETGIAVPISPKVTVDPLPTVYLRRAEVYRTLREALSEAFGAALSRTPRLTPAGRAPDSIERALADAEDLFRAAAAAAWRELGVVPERTVAGWSGDSRALARRFAGRRRALERDADVAADARMMVPVSYDPETRRTRVWAFLGWVRREAWISFRRPPRVTAERVGGGETRRPVRVVPELRARRAAVEVPVVVEATVPRRLDRDTFRRLCDRHRTQAKIVAAITRGAE